jgi:hypothetical protein
MGHHKIWQLTAKYISITVATLINMYDTRTIFENFLSTQLFQEYFHSTEIW